jgi:hypothetical protein
LNATNQTSVNVSLSVSTMAPSTSWPTNFNRPKGPWQWASGEGLLLVCIFLAWTFFVAHRRKRLHLSTAIALVAIASLLLSACGGGGSGVVGPTNPGTPVGLYSNVVVTVSGAGINPPLTLNLTVNVK